MVRTWRYLAGFLPLLLHAQAALQIIEPGSGAVVRPGQTVVVAVRTGNSYASVWLLTDGALKATQTLSAAPFQFSIHVPTDIVAGWYRIWATGCRRPGDCDEFAPVTIEVEPIWRESADGSRLVSDASGVTVDMGGAPVMHRSAIPYPRESAAKGIGGTAVVEIAPDWEGRVEGIRFLSGPDELRESTIKAVLMWHLPRQAGRKARQVKITFDPVEAYHPAAAPSAGEIAKLGSPSSSTQFWSLVRGHPAQTLKSIDAMALSEDARNALLSQMPVHPGEAIDANAVQTVVNAVGNFDHDLTVWLMREGAGFSIAITPPGFRLQDMGPAGRPETAAIAAPPPARQFTPQRIRVPAAAQAAKLVSKVEPDYPSLAKANHIQGAVRFSAILGDDGRVIDVLVMRGHPLLVQAARDAVAQWRYSPTVVNGMPVQVATEIEVEFFLPN